MKNICKYLYIVCIVLIFGFIVRLGIDYFKYDDINTSAPFYTFIIIRAIEFILPTIILFIVGKVMEK